MTRLLLFVKHKLPFLWGWVEWLNTLLFRILHGGKLKRQAEQSLREFTLEGYTFRMIQRADLKTLYDLIHRQAQGRLTYFRPHKFEMKELEKANRNPAFLMFGVFHQESLIGYFFLRCFWNRKCFVGRLIDEPFEKKGIGRVMNQIMYQTAWRSGFRCFTTISRDNSWVIRSHVNNPTTRVVKSLNHNFLLVEFVAEDRLQAAHLPTLKDFLETPGR